MCVLNIRSYSDLGVYYNTNSHKSQAHSCYIRIQ